MAVRLRLARFGRIHRPFYRIGVFDSRSRRDGEALQYIGFYDPMENSDVRLKLDKEAAIAWLAKGAQPTPTVASFLRAEGVPYKKLEAKVKRNKERTDKRLAKKKAAGKTNPVPAAAAKKSKKSS